MHRFQIGRSRWFCTVLLGGLLLSASPAWARGDPHIAQPLSGILL